MNAPIRFPLRQRLAHDVHGGLYRELAAHIEATAQFLDGKGRTVYRVADDRQRIAYSLASQRLTTRLMEASAIMTLARNWLDDQVADDDAITQLGRIRIGSERWWDEETTPPQLIALCVIAEVLLSRVKGVGERLRRAVEEENRGRAA